MSLLPKPSAKERKAQALLARAADNAETAELRAVVFERSRGFCECACGRRPAEMDHFLGRSVPQTAENCWALAAECHGQKTRNEPSVAEWNARFAAHCNRHGYPVVARLVKQRQVRHA